MATVDSHSFKQKQAFDDCYSEVRGYWFTTNPLTRYVVRWRLFTAINRLMSASEGRFTKHARILFLCAGDGAEASACCDEFGFTNVTFSDISPVAVNAGTKRDARLDGLVLSADSLDLPDSSYDIAIVQDGLHHLRSPVRGFTEMLRVARTGVIFVEPSDTKIGRSFGTEWEVNGEAVNFVFRWNYRLVDQITCSWIGSRKFKNLSYSYWHHTTALERIGKLFGGGEFGRRAVSGLKFLLDHLLHGMGNNFSGIILKLVYSP